MIERLNTLRPVEPIPKHVRSARLAALLGDNVLSQPCVYFRWHDSGDLFHTEYARAVLEVCQRTSGVLHWLPTRMGPMVASLVEQGAKLPGNLALLISCHRGGVREKFQIQALRRIVAAEPDARAGLTYAVNGPRSREVDSIKMREDFGPDANICPATIAKRSADRSCIGCRRCWTIDGRRRINRRSFTLFTTPIDDEHKETKGPPRSRSMASTQLRSFREQVA